MEDRLSFEEIEQIVEDLEKFEAVKKRQPLPVLSSLTLTSRPILTRNFPSAFFFFITAIVWVLNYYVMPI